MGWDSGYFPLPWPSLILIDFSDDKTAHHEGPWIGTLCDNLVTDGSVVGPTRCVQDMPFVVWHLSLSWDFQPQPLPSGDSRIVSS